MKTRKYEARFSPESSYRRGVNTGSCGIRSSPPWWSWGWSSGRRAALGGLWHAALGGSDPGAQTSLKLGTGRAWGLEGRQRDPNISLVSERINSRKPDCWVSEGRCSSTVPAWILLVPRELSHWAVWSTAVEFVYLWFIFQVWKLPSIKGTLSSCKGTLVQFTTMWAQRSRLTAGG